MTSSAAVLKKADHIGTALEVTSLGVDVVTAKTPQEAAKNAFVDSMGIWGGRGGTAVGVTMAFGEEGAMPIVSTPVAIVTIASSNALGTAIGKGVGEIVWDIGEASKNEISKWNYRK